MNKVYQAAKCVVSRRNQDGVFILMKSDDPAFFFKLTGWAAAVWSELEAPKSLQELLFHFTALQPDHAADLESDIPELLASLVAKGLLSEQTGESTAFRTEAQFPNGLLESEEYHFGGLNEFDLAQIESEVLNDSIYLDVFAGSDLRLKRDIKPIENALEKVAQLNGVTFRWDEHAASRGTDDLRHAGLIAQDVAMHMPELVRRDAKAGLLAVEYSKLNGYLVEAIKELRRVTEAQAERIRDLENRLN